MFGFSLWAVIVEQTFLSVGVSHATRQCCPSASRLLACFCSRLFVIRHSESNCFGLRSALLISHGWQEANISHAMKVHSWSIWRVVSSGWVLQQDAACAPQVWSWAPSWGCCCAT